MHINIRSFEEKDIKETITVWNEVVEDGVAFPQMESLDEMSGMEFFSHSHLQVLPVMRTKILLAYIFFILIM